MDAPPRRYCPHGHDKVEVGSRKGRCLACAREGGRRHYYRHRGPLAERPAPMPGLAPARRKLGLTQSQLAEMAGVSAVTVAKIEQGKHAPLPATRKKLVEVLEAIIRQRRDEAERRRELADRRARAGL